jgi:hypothetical protein
MLRPKLASFRATSFHGDNPGPADGGALWKLEVTQQMELGVGIATSPATSPAKHIQALVQITMTARATSETAGAAAADFTATYQAKYDYPPETTEEQATDRIRDEAHQYELMSQAFPLAMVHFKRELLAFGLDARELPLGIAQEWAHDTGPSRS